MDASAPAPNDTPLAYVLVGATATGKTAVAHCLARKHGWALLSADAMQVYRGMDIGTAKPDRRERIGLLYGGLDLVDPCAAFSVGDYLHAVRAEWARLATAPAVLVLGGSGLYVRALLEGLDTPASVPALRAEAEELLARGGIEALQRAIEERSSAIWAALRDPLNPRRLVRAYEQAVLGASSPRPRAPLRRAVLIGLRTDPGVLAERIRRRAIAMFDRGLLEEAEALRRRWDSLSETAEKAIGYREAFDVLDGRCSREEAIERVVLRTRQYAKRQMTWFRHQAVVEWIQTDESRTADEWAVIIRPSMEHHGRIALHGIQ